MASVPNTPPSICAGSIDILCHPLLSKPLYSFCSSRVLNLPRRNQQTADTPNHSTTVGTWQSVLIRGVASFSGVNLVA